MRISHYLIRMQFSFFVRHYDFSFAKDTIFSERVYFGRQSDIISRFTTKRTWCALSYTALALARENVDLNEPLTDFMSKPVITIQSNSSARDAIHLMSSKNIRRIIVVDSNEKIVGIVTQEDIFKEISKNPNMITSFVGEKYPAEYREVYSRFTDYMLDFIPKL